MKPLIKNWSYWNKPLIFIFRLLVTQGGLTIGEENCKGTPLAQFTCYRDFTAMELDQLVNDCQSQPGLPVLGVHPRLVGLIVAFPDIVLLLSCHPDTVILNDKLRPVSSLLTADPNHTILRELNCVLDNIKHNLHEAVVIGIYQETVWH